MKKLAILIFILISVSTIVLGNVSNKDRKDKIKDLDKKYKEWLDLVYYIITPIEREIFLSLGDDKSRDIFIEAFWKRRDPTPGTPENEFKDEHIRRFQWANKYLRDGVRPGWKTDRGKFYIILGEPISKTKIETIDVYPVEIWYYNSEEGSNLPSHFALVFYRKGGSGEYKLYDPLIDGPDSLFLQRQPYNVFDYEKLYEKLRELSPSLADVALSPIPGEIPYNYQPTSKTAILTKDILELPKKRIDTEYARNFNKYKGIVDVEYTVNYLSNYNNITLQPINAADYAFVHYAIKFKTLTFDIYKDKYYTNLELNGAIKDRKDKIIFQYKKNYSLYFDENQFNAVKRSGLVIEDLIPIISGSYKIQILLKNTLSKEFTFAEAELEIPKEGIILSEPIFAYEVEKDFSEDIKPYKISSNIFKIDPENVYTQSDTMYYHYEINNLNKDSSYALKINVSDGVKIFKQINKEIRLPEGFYEDTVQIKMNEFTSGRYKINLKLYDNKGIKLAEKGNYFDVSSLSSLGRPNYAFKIFPEENKFLLWQILGDENFAIGNYDKALQYYNKAHNEKIDYLPSIKRILEILMITKKADEAIEFIKNIKINYKDEDFYYLCGKAYEINQEYNEAENNYLESLRISRNIRTLNALALLYIKLKRIEEGRKLLEESLEINPNQEEIKKLLGNIKSGE